MRYLAFAFLLVPCVAMAQPAQQRDPVAQAISEVTNTLTMSLISAKAEALQCRAELEKAKEPTAPK